MSLTIEDLPHAIIEYIFSYLSPYRDLKQCMLVNKCWYELVQTAVQKIQRDFHFAVTTRNVCWHHFHAESGPTISRRYSHSACICGNSMYVFGGCTTASTTFNDLWRLDLATRRWIRPLATGTYPPPKACASMVCYKDNLILLGGWTHTSPYPLHQAWHIFNHLHVYNTNTNRWNHVVTSSSSCPGMAGHTASIVGDKMVVFGGLHCQSGWGPFSSSNDIWVLDLKCMAWRKQSVTSPTPHPRYGHSQITIDEKHLMIIGGCGGPNMLFSDIWLLTLSEDSTAPWEWKEMEIQQKPNAAPHLTFHPACKVDSKVVVLSKARWSRMSPSCFPQLLRAPSRIWVPPYVPQVFARPEPRPMISQSAEKENCVNGKKGVLKRHLNRSLQRQRTGSNASSSDDDDVQANAMKKVVNTSRVPPREAHSLAQPSTSMESGTNCNRIPESACNSGTDVNSLKVNSFSPSDKVPRNGLPTTSSTSVSRLTLSVRPNAWRNRQRQLEGLDRMEQRLRTLRSGVSSVNENRQDIPSSSLASSSASTSISSVSCSSGINPKNPLCLYVLDISHAVMEGHVSWTPPQQHSQGTSGLEEVILYSLLLGRRELVMFGGIQKDLNSYQSDCEKVPQIVSNSLHFISGLRYVI